MRFRVGPYAYRARITEEPLVDEKTGEALAGMAVSQGREILIAATVPPEERMEVLSHELKHAWFFHFPKPRTEEEDCNLYAAISQQMTNDLDEQGGIGALMRMKPLDYLPPDPIDDVVPPSTLPDDDETRRLVPPLYLHSFEIKAAKKAAASGGRAHCKDCGMQFNAGFIVTSPPKWNFKATGLTVTRTLFCPHCDHLQTWIEGALYGLPNGALVEEPTFERGRAVEKFLRDHPEMSGSITA